ncbi:MAG: hypothetical protein JO112_15815 [Planctomycetes bacterium]|nr:hypothetical protein [Planctomycetota bacterium]
MTTMTAIVRNGQLELPRPIDLPDGTEVEIRLPQPEGNDSSREDEGPVTPEEISRTLAAMEKIEPLELSEEEQAAWEADRQARKEWEKAHFDQHAEKLREIWE